MSKITCEYNHSETAVATRKCDECGALLCQQCGYVDEEEKDYCSVCWEAKRKTFALED